MKNKNELNGVPEELQNWGVIHAYTRAQALSDGLLIDVTPLAKEAGFRYPVAMTAEAWGLCVRVPKGASCQDETGRLWDVLNLLNFAIRSSKSPVIRFSVSVHQGRKIETVNLKALCGPGDDGEPVVTILLPDQD